MALKIAGFAAPVAQLNRSNQKSSETVARLSSGKRIVRASNDVAGMSVAAQLQVRVISLRTALLNTAQASSLLEVAEGGLQQVQAALERMLALSTQANSGGITDRERAFLNIELTNLRDEIDRITTHTSFSGMQILETDTSRQFINPLALDDEQAFNPYAMLQFVQNPTNNQTFRIQNVVFRFRTAPVNALTDVRIGTSIQQTVTNLAQKLSDHTSLRMKEATYTVDGVYLRIESRSNGDVARTFSIDEQGSSARNRFNVIDGDVVHTSGQRRYSLTGETGTGLGMASVVGYGQINDSLVRSQIQIPGEARLNITNLTGGINNNQQLRIDDGFGGLNQFVFRTNPVVGNALHIRIGANNEETLKNAVVTLTNWVNNSANSRIYAHRQLEFERDGLSLIIRSKFSGNPADFTELNVALTETTTGGVLSSASITSGVNSGFDTVGVANKDFVGAIGGFSATYVSYNRVQASITVGQATYTADIANTNPQAADNIVRFYSEAHGYFDVTFAAGNGIEVLSQEDADMFAYRLNAAVSGINFYQSRNATSLYTGAVPELAGATLKLQTDSYTDPVVVENISVVAATQNSGRAQISMTVNGEEFITGDSIKSYVEQYQRIRLYSAIDSSRIITLMLGNTYNSLNSAEDAQAFETALDSAIPLGQVVDGTRNVSFNLGRKSTNTLEFELRNVTSDMLFDSNNVDVSTQERAAIASNIISEAIDRLTSVRAEYGAIQSRLNYADSFIRSSMQSQDEAHSVIANTDIAKESTRFAQHTVKSQMAIAMVAQANSLKPEVLRLLERN